LFLKSLINTKIINLKENTKQDIQDVVEGCLLTRYSNLFSSYLQKLSPSTRETIRHNKELNELYDLFLDFTIDASQHLDYIYAKKTEKEIE